MGRRELVFGLYYSSLPMLGRIAGAYRRTIIKRTRVVAVTGSFGKTTTGRAIKAVLGVPIDPDVGITQPSFKAREILRMRPGDRHGVVETSIESPGHMRFAARFIRPDIAVVTAIGTEHLRAFGSIEAIRNEKADLVRILTSRGCAVLNGDDPNTRWMRDQTRARVLTFGLGPGSDVYASEVAMDWPHGMGFVLHAMGETRPMRIRLIGRHMVYPALAAAAVGLAEGIALDRIAQALEMLEPTPSRMQPVALPNGAFLVRDEFKSPLETIESALNILAEIPASRRIVVIGQISEAPGGVRVMQRRVGELVARVASYAIFFGLDSRSYATGAVRAGLDRKSLLDAGVDIPLIVKTLSAMLREGDVVLIKGRTSEKLDRIALALSGRTVGCTLGFCDAELRCAICPMLEGGWAGYPARVAPRNPAREWPHPGALEPRLKSSD